MDSTSIIKINTPGIEETLPLPEFFAYEFTGDYENDEIVMNNIVSRIFEQGLNVIKNGVNEVTHRYAEFMLEVVTQQDEIASEELYKVLDANSIKLQKNAAKLNLSLEENLILSFLKYSKDDFLSYKIGKLSKLSSEEFNQKLLELYEFESKAFSGTGITQYIDQIMQYCTNLQSSFRDAHPDTQVEGHSVFNFMATHMFKLRASQQYGEIKDWQEVIRENKLMFIQLSKGIKLYSDFKASFQNLLKFLLNPNL